MTLTAEACFQKKRRYLRVDFHVVSEADVVDDMVSELMCCKGRTYDVDCMRRRRGITSGLTSM